MKVEVIIDPGCPEPAVTIRAAAMTEEVAALVNQLSGTNPAPLTGIKDEKLVLIEEKDLIRVFSADGRVYAATAKGEFLLRQRLYEMEERLDPRSFVRISNGEIINLKKARGFDLKLSGTICVSLEGGVVTYVSRRYVKKIRQVLGV